MIDGVLEPESSGDGVREKDIREIEPSDEVIVLFAIPGPAGHIEKIARLI